MSFLDYIFISHENCACKNKNFIEIEKNGRLFWLIDENIKAPSFLLTYPKITYKAKLYAFIIKAIWFLKLKRVFFTANTYRVDDKSIYSILTSKFNEVSIFTGTPGLNRKIIVTCRDKDTKLFFKIPTSLDSKKLVKNELYSIIKVTGYDLGKHKIPKIVELNDDLFGISDISNIKLYSKHNDTYEKVSDFYHKLYCASSFTLDTSTLRQQFIKELEANQSLKSNSLVLDALIEKSINYQRKILELFSLSIPDCLTLYFSHGDLTPWNIFVGESNLAVFDWELAGNRTKYFDLIHFYVSKAILVDRENAESIHKRITGIIRKYFPEENNSNIDLYICFYFLYQSNYYFSKYKKQTDEIHEQVYWQLEAWNCFFEFYLVGKSK